MKAGARYCMECKFRDGREICTRDGSGYSGKYRGNMEPACEAFRGRTAAKLQNEAKGYTFMPEAGSVRKYNAISLESADALAANVQQMGKYILQMGQMLGAMQKRMDELEARQKAVTISHAEVKQLNARIRKQAYDWCTRYRLIDEECAKKARAAIKKDVLRMNQVRDLHDLPAAMLAAVQQQIDDWTDFRLVMELRKAART